MLLFAHMGLALAFARPLDRASLAFLILSSMLPDIIDKPLGLIVFGSPNMGRTFAHTLLFLMLLAVPAFYYREMRFISMAWGVQVHLVLDFLWNSPETLLWPFLGAFPGAPILDTLSYTEMLLLGLEDPGILLPEIAGMAYLMFFAVTRRMQACAWIDRTLQRSRQKAGLSCRLWRGT